MRLYGGPFRIGCFLMRNDLGWCLLSSSMLGFWGPALGNFRPRNQPGKQEGTRGGFEVGVGVAGPEFWAWNFEFGVLNLARASSFDL